MLCPARETAPEWTQSCPGQSLCVTDTAPPAAVTVSV